MALRGTGDPREEELAGLRNARGQEFDRLYLRVTLALASGEQVTLTSVTGA